MTQTGTQMGTPVYMSPEQVKGEKSIDHRSDIYALGVTLYFTLTGKAPYESAEESSYEIFTKIINEPIPSLENNPIFDAIIQKAASKDRNTRYQSVEEMRKVLNTSVSISNVQSATKQQSIDDAPKEKVIENKEVKQQKLPIVRQNSGAATAAFLVGIIGFLISSPTIYLILAITAIGLGLKGLLSLSGLKEKTLGVTMASFKHQTSLKLKNLATSVLHCFRINTSKNLGF